MESHTEAGLLLSEYIIRGIDGCDVSDIIGLVDTQEADG